jgi:hypothetical protein
MWPPRQPPAFAEKKMVIAAEILTEATQHVAADRSLYQILAG